MATKARIPRVQHVVPFVFPRTPFNRSCCTFILPSFPSSCFSASFMTSLSFSRFSLNVCDDVFNADERDVRSDNRDDCNAWWCESRSDDVTPDEESAGSRSEMAEDLPPGLADDDEAAAASSRSRSFSFSCSLSCRLRSHGGATVRCRRPEEAEVPVLDDSREACGGSSGGSEGGDGD